MTQKDKELLLKDLCARLPYKIRVSTPDKPICAINSIPNINSTIVIDGSGERVYPIKDIKPYLFPLSSMTEEQKAELEQIKNNEDAPYYHDINDFFLKYHLDNRHLIEKGLALDATGLNIY